MSTLTIETATAFRDDTAPTDDSRMVVVTDDDGARFILFETGDHFHFCSMMCMRDVLADDFDHPAAPDEGREIVHRYLTGNTNFDGTPAEQAIVVSWGRTCTDEHRDGARCENEHCGDFL